MTRQERALAEVLADLVSELVDEVQTAETMTRHRTVRRGRGRDVVVSEVLAHRTVQVGLLEQLRATTQAPGGRLERVAVKGPKGLPLRVPVLDEHGRQLIRPRWEWDDPNERKTGRYVDTPITQPLTRLRRGGERRPGSAVPGAAVPGGSPGWDADGALSPIRAGTASSRPPTTEATWLLMDIEASARRLYGQLLAATGTPRARSGLGEILRHLVALALDVDDRAAARAVAAARSWVSAARLITGYDAPVVRLRDIGCPTCGGDLHVRSDASTDVWCTGRQIIHGPALEGEPWPVEHPCGLTYPRATWLDLFATNETPAKRTPTKTQPARMGQLDGYGGRP